jgi:predicted transcriptional regulator
MTEKIEELNQIRPTKLYTATQIAGLLHVTERTIRKYCTECVFPNAVKIAGGRRWLIPGSDITEILSIGGDA